MDKLLPYYEQELTLLGRSIRDFAARYPKIAARLSITDGRVDDPHVERLLQTFSLLGARISQTLDDDYPTFTEALIETLHPDYLRPFPSCAIAQFEVGDAFSRLTEPSTIPRGTELESRTGACRFRTAYDVTLAPVSITQARFSPAAAAPLRASLPANATGILSITLASLTDERAFGSTFPACLRIHLHGEAPLVAALLDALLLHAPAAFVEADQGGRWKALSCVPVTAVGFDESDALVASSGHAAMPGFRLLREYFCFPDKFAFVDIDLGRLVRACGPCRRLTLHLPVVDMPVDTPSGRALEMLSATHLRLFCSPVINLFKREAVPVVLKSGVYTYPIAPQALLMQGIEVHSIDAVRMTPRGAPDAQGSIVIPPFHELVHERSTDTPAPYWIAHRDRREHPGSPQRQAELTFVDLDGTPFKPDTDQIAIDLTCTNADRPSALPFGTPDGDLLNENENLAARISLLRRASPSQTRPQDPGALWRLIAGMTPHALTLQPSGLSGLKDLLNLHLAGASRAAPQIDAITRLDHKSVVQWMAVKPMSTFVRGIEIALTVDESAFTAFSLHTFSGVIDRFFAPYAPSNGFVRLVIHATGSGRELRRCRPQFGASPLL